MGAPVDTLQPEWLHVTIGEAADELGKRVAEALFWANASYDPANSEAELGGGLQKWFDRTRQSLESIFVPSENALAFCVAGTSTLPFNPPIARHRAVHQACSRELVSIVRQLRAERATIASALEDLEDRIGRHQQLIDRLRAIEADSESTWEKLVRDPLLASPVSKLLNNGISQSAIWDALKQFVPYAASVLAGQL